MENLREEITFASLHNCRFIHQPFTGPFFIPGDDPAFLDVAAGF
jgi:hypothetical protein